jgi:integrase
VVAVTLGLRRGELLGLRWSSVDLVGGTLRVRETVQRTSGGLVLDETKTARSARTLPLRRITAEALRDHGERQDKERVGVGRGWREHGLVFPSPIGTPMDPRHLDREFAELLRRAGLRRVRLHDLRHTCATFLLAQGVPLRVVMEILGHSGIAITSDTYTHVLPTLLADAIGTMDDLLRDEQEDQDDDTQDSDG